MKRKIILALILATASAAFFGFYYSSENKPTDGSENKPIACTQEAKLCLDGSAVGGIPPNCEFAPCPKEDLIQVETPRANELVSSPVVIKGKARGKWFFEGSFPVELYDEENNLIARDIAKAKADWMTGNFVPFEAELLFVKKPATERGKLILRKDNPSGRPELDDHIEISALFPATREIKLYYYNSELDRDEKDNVLCSRKGITDVRRAIPLTQTPIKDTLELLLKGKLTIEERNRGITTEYPLEGFLLKEINLKKDGALILEFADPLGKTIGGSCRTGILWMQIEATAKQFSEVKKAELLPETYLFQP